MADIDRDDIDVADPIIGIEVSSFSRVNIAVLDSDDDYASDGDHRQFGLDSESEPESEVDDAAMYVLEVIDIDSPPPSPPPPPVSDDIAGSASSPPLVAGRPRLDIDLAAPVWGPINIPTTDKNIGQLLQSMFTVFNRYNITDAAASAIVDVVKQYTPHPIRIPNWSQAETVLVRSSNIKARHHVACVNDCWIDPRALEDYDSKSDADMEKLELMRGIRRPHPRKSVINCPICDHPLVDEQRRWNRVSVEEGGV